MFKECSICKQSKPYYSFTKRKESKDGLRNDCKECINKRRREWFANSNYYENNKETLSNNHKKWKDKNPSIIKNISKRYYDNNKEKCLNYRM